MTCAAVATGKVVQQILLQIHVFSQFLSSCFLRVDRVFEHLLSQIPFPSLSSVIREIEEKFAALFDRNRDNRSVECVKCIQGNREHGQIKREPENIGKQ